MQSEGVIGKYALGGAVGAAFYLAPAATIDIDIFLDLPANTGPLVSLAPVYQYLAKHGCQPTGEHIQIGGWPVQFLPVSNPLEREALSNAALVDLRGTPVPIMTAEHLVAIALATGRNKDFARVSQFLEQEAVDQDKLMAILERYNLLQNWLTFRKRYVE